MAVALQVVHPLVRLVVVLYCTCNGLLACFLKVDWNTYLCLQLRNVSLVYRYGCLTCAVSSFWRHLVFVTGAAVWCAVLESLLSVKVDLGMVQLHHVEERDEQYLLTSVHAPRIGQGGQEGRPMGKSQVHCHVEMLITLQSRHMLTQMSV